MEMAIPGFYPLPEALLSLLWIHAQAKSRSCCYSARSRIDPCHKKSM
jgi:hypothetical protein